MPHAVAQAAVDGALRQREWQAQKVPGEAARALRGCGSPEWLVSEKPRRALLSAAQAVIRHAAPSHRLWSTELQTCSLLPMTALLQACEA